MSHYIILFFLLLFILNVSSNNLWDDNNTNKKGFFVCLFILALLSALKASTVGNDTHEYLRLFEMGDGISSAGTRYEFGYIYYNILLHKISGSPQILFIVSSLIIYVSIGRFIWKYSRMPWLSIMIFFSYSLFGFTMSALRQSLAIAVLFVSFDFLIRKKYIWFITLVLLASTFHSSALIFLVCPIFNYIKPTPKTFFICFIIAVMALLFLGNILQTAFGYLDYYSHYQYGEYFEGETRLASFIQLLLSIFILTIGYKSLNSGDNNIVNNYDHMELLLMIQAMAVFLCFLCLKVNLIDRMVLYFSSFTIIMIPNAMARLSTIRKKRWTTMILFILFFYTLSVLVFRPNWNSVFPYKFYWQEIERIIY